MRFSWQCVFVLVMCQLNLFLCFCLFFYRNLWLKLTIRWWKVLDNISTLLSIYDAVVVIINILKYKIWWFSVSLISFDMMWWIRVIRVSLDSFWWISILNGSEGQLLINLERTNVSVNTSICWFHYICFNLFFSLFLP